jgi:PAS domain S-box-containing protein
LLTKPPASDKLAVRLMLAGIGLALGPGIVLYVFPAVLSVPLPTGPALYVAVFAIPLLPSAYIYAIYKRRLGDLEFRANRLLSRYSFILLYVTVFVLIFYVGSLWVDLPQGAVVFSLIVSTALAIAALPLRARFQRWVDRLAYGAKHDPDEIVRIFVNQIPLALNLDALAHLLAEEVAPSLLVRQSALYSLKDGEVHLVYARGVELAETPETPRQIRRLLAESGRYRPPPLEPQDECDWVRLAIPVAMRQKTVGLWLFGRRDPDDYYPQNDITLLNTLAGQVAVAIENSQLYEQARQEIAERKRAEEALRESEAKYRSLVTQSLQGIFIVQVSPLRLVFANPAFANILGLSLEEVLSLSPQSIEDMMHPEERSFLLQRVGDLFEGAPSSSRAIRVVRRDGTIRWVEVFARRIEYEGEPALQLAAMDVTERKEAEGALEHRLEQLTALSQASQAVTASLELDQVLAKVVSLASEVVASDYTGVVLVDEAGDVGRSAESLPGVPALEYRIREEGLTSWIVRSRQPVIVDEIGEDGTMRPDLGEGAPRLANPLLVETGVKSLAGLPLMVKDRLLGVLYVHSLQASAFHDQLPLLTTFANQAAIAIENGRLFEAERGQRELAEALEEAAAAVGSTLQLDQVLDRILEQVERVVVGDAFNIMLLEDRDARVARWRGYELQKAEPAADRTYSIDEIPSLLKMVQTGKPVVIPDTASDPDWIQLKGREWLRSYVAAPIHVGGMTVGFLNVNGTRAGQFGPADAQRLQAFANHAAAAVENAQLYRELRGYAYRLEERVQERTAQFQAQYARLQAILHSTADGIIVADGQGEIIQTNPIADNWLVRALSPEDAVRLREAVRDLARQAEERPEMVLELTGLDLELSAAPIIEPGVEGAAVVIAAHDISHLKALDRMKNRFVSNVSHELRTPITTIKLYAALMRKASPEKLQGYMDVLAQEADHQARLVEDILQISRIDAGRLGMEPRPTSLNELTDVAIVNHCVLAQEQGLTLEHRPAEPGPVALVDPDRMMQVLNNLVKNGISYTPEGGEVVVSTGEGKIDGRAWATVTVADTGMGIPENELAHIFERFFRGEQPQLMQLSGTGLGLAISKDIVELHGGRVTVESEVGKGSAFTVWLPLVGEVG